MSISTLECVPGIETSFKFLDRVKRCVCVRANIWNIHRITSVHFYREPRTGRQSSETILEAANALLACRG